MSERIRVYRVVGGFHACDLDLRLTAFGVSEDTARAEIRRLRGLCERLAIQYAAAPPLDRMNANRVA